MKQGDPIFQTITERIVKSCDSNNKCIVFAPKNCKGTLKEFDIDHVLLGGEVQ